MREERSVIHLNVADFAVQVERLMDPRLRGRPMIIAAEGGARSVVYDMSDEAYGMGVRKGMPLRMASRLCRDATVLPPHTDRYERAVQELWQHALPYSPRVEIPDGDGHLFVDTTGTGMLFGSPWDVAWRLRKEIKARLGLYPIWSVAPNKLTAKVATRVVKPAGELILGHGEEEAFLAPLPVDLLPGIEAEDLYRLKGEFRLRRIRDLAAWTIPQLQVVFGKRSRHLHQASRGIDPTPVAMAGQRPLETSASHLFGEDTNHWPMLEAVLYTLAEQVGWDLREKRLVAGKVVVVVDFTDGARAVRQKKTARATAMDLALFEAARCALHAAAFNRRGRIRHLKLSAGLVTYPPAQLELFPAYCEEAGGAPAGAQITGGAGGAAIPTWPVIHTSPDYPTTEMAATTAAHPPQTVCEDLTAAMDSIRTKFGKTAIKTGRTMQLHHSSP